MSQVIVVGGGLSGLSAAHTIMQRGGNVLLLDKNPFLGGNSTKATSGINGALTKAQIKLGIKDSQEIFARDTALSASKGQSDKVSPLGGVLTGESAESIEWLIKHFGLDLSLVSQLGGHSMPRTHRGPEKFPGMTITYALMEALEKIDKETDGKKGKIITDANVKKLITENGEVVGVEYVKDGSTHKAYGPVVLATGGYGADFSKTGILAKVRPDLLDYATTNGDHCTGDGIKMAQEVGGAPVDLEYVQVHPTGLVDPADAGAKVKFLAAEALRGVGGLLLDGNGQRFVNELATRDHVSEVMGKNKGPFRLVLNGKSSKEIEWHCKHYVGRGLMKRLTGQELAKEIGISPQKLEETFKKYNEVAKKGIDEFGKKYFQNLPITIDDTFHVAQVCPLVHYCMGGIKISPEGAVLSPDNKPIKGLFACGEVTGGVHGKNRLGGSSLTECVVYGRVSGGSAAQFLLQKLSQRGSGSARTGDGTIELSLRQVDAKVTLQPSSSGLSVNISWDGESQQHTQPSSSSTPSKPVTTPEEVKAAQPETKSGSDKKGPTKQGTYTLEEVAKHNKEGDLWVVVNGQVLDVTHFMKRHPGGAKAILLYAGKDATEEFNMLHDANVIEKYAPETVIGTLAGSNLKSKL
jgi:flavocytochrome c